MRRRAQKARVALVTGAASGIGEAVARRLASAGLRVAYSDLRPPAAPRGALSLALDVTSETSVDRAVQTILSRLGRLDCVVHSAGSYGEGSVLALAPDAYRAMLDVHLLGAVRLTRAAAPHMIQNGGGRIVHVASVAALRGTPLAGHYAAAKAALVSFTRTSAVELAAARVRVNAVVPGLVETPMARGRRPVLDTFALGRVPAGRYARADEVAEVVEFLCTSRTDYVTGAALVVDGGLTAR